MTLWNQVLSLYPLSTDGEVLERAEPTGDAVDPAPVSSGTNGDGPPGADRRPEDSDVPTPEGRGPRELWILLVGVVLSTAASGASASADLPWWSHLLVGAAGAAGLYFLWPKSTRRSGVASFRVGRLLIAALIVAASTFMGIGAAAIISNIQCSNAVGSGLDPASKGAFKTAYSWGGRDRFGCPKRGPFNREGGTFQTFSDGRAGLGAFGGEPGEPPIPLFGAIWRYYSALGRGLRDAASLAGIPTESKREGVSRVVYLTGGECGQGGLYRPRPGHVYWVMAELYEEYVGRGGHLGPLGFPVSDPVVRGKRVKQKFDEGVLRAKVDDFKSCYLLA